MRAALGLLLLLALPATAGFGAYEDGWPVAADGTSTAPPLNQAAGATVYPYWPLLTAEVLRLADEHPDLVRLITAGRSVAGLDLYMLEIADHARIEAGKGIPYEEREVLWVDGGTHSNEYSGVYFTLAWAQFLLDEYAANETARWIVENRHTWIMPMVNPDGSNAMGRLNLNGVNINRNYPVVWDGEGHDPLLNNRGPYPASEPETRATLDGYNRTMPDYMASVHCCGNLWLYPFGEEGVDPVDEAMFSRVCDEAFPTVREDCGPIWSTIYPASGSSVDSAYAYTGAVSFGYEMSGRGAAALWGQPVTFEDVRTQEIESWQGLEHAFLHVERYGAHLVIDAVEATDDTLRVALRNDGYGPLTGGTLALLPAEGGTSGDRPREMVLPALAPEETAVITVAWQAPSAYDLHLDYPKRLQAGPLRQVEVPLLLIDRDGGTHPDADAIVLDVPDRSASVPMPLVIGVAALAVLVLLRRR